ncbi:LexA family transcriptional regulator [Myxosarcina sp. GI1]|uniref:LexA family protein n=1 Tax=Myxosarcina sp. GI1 TaxID=1541065 RepID=UPI000AA10509|nr:translesion error-prone DNA polymerase V autoproteolytic subunit [Myxosarcina sp. GI1]
MSIICPTKVDEVYRARTSKHYSIPLYSCNVAAGFPSPADEFLEGKLDLNQHLIPHPLATYFVRVSGESMLGAGIHPGDLLIVDRSIEPKENKVVIAVVNGELLVKRLKYCGKQPYLIAEHPDYPELAITEAMEFQIWGVVTNVIHAL